MPVSAHWAEFYFLAVSYGFDGAPQHRFGATTALRIRVALPGSLRSVSAHPAVRGEAAGLRQVDS